MNRPSTRIGVLAIVLCLALLGGAIATFRAIRHRSAEWASVTNPDDRALILSGRRQYAALRSFTPVAGLLSPHVPPDANDAAGPALRPASPLTELSELAAPLLAPGDADAITRAVAEFLHYRFAQADPDVYIAWKLSRGYQWEPWDRLNEGWRIERTWPSLTGSPFPTGATVEDLFRRAFKPITEWPDGRSAVVAISTDPKAQAITVGRMSEQKPYADGLAGDRGEDFWEGANTGTWSRWFSPPSISRELMRAHGAVQYAHVGLIAEAASGRRFPIYMIFIHDPMRNRWFLESAGLNNTVPDRNSAMYF